MKITITIEDNEYGDCKVDSDPAMPQLVKMHRDRVKSPAVGYAVLALGTLIKANLKEAQEKMKEKLKGQIITPDRFTLQ